MKELFPNATNKLSRWVFNGDFGRYFAAILDLQMWCFGCDIRKTEGNLALQYGYKRLRPGNTAEGASRYFKQIDADHQIHLWGFAIVISNSSYGLCIKRNQRTPIIAPITELRFDIWKPSDLPSFLPPQTDTERNEALKLLSVCAKELISYESAIEDIVGGSYRAQCLKQRRQSKIFGKLSLKNAWRELDEKVCITFFSARRSISQL